MPRRKSIEYEETRYIRDMARIMAVGSGPFTKTMLREELRKVYPALSLQELNNIISGAIEIDKYVNNRFKVARPGWWDLAVRENIQPENQPNEFPLEPYSDVNL